MRRLLLPIAAAALLAAAPAAADHVAGATYSGEHGADGPLRFTVSADGRRITSYLIEQARAGRCTFRAQGDEGVWKGVAVMDHAFGYHVDSRNFVEGRFAPDGQASGTLRIYSRAVPGTRPACDTGVVAWTASTAALHGGGAPASGAPAAGGTAPEVTITPARKRVRTGILLLRRGRAWIAGRVRSPNRRCRPARTVILRHGGLRLAATTSRRNGAFRFRRTAAMHGRRLRIRVDARLLPGLRCGAATPKAFPG